MELDVKLIELKHLKYILSNAINNEEKNYKLHIENKARKEIQYHNIMWVIVIIMVII